VPPEDRVDEVPPPTAPLHRYVSLFDARRGVTVMSDGLAEYEARENGEIAVTLLRAVGELSRNDLPERPGHAGWPVHTPDAQSLGPFSASLAVMPHGPRSVETIDAVERACDDFLLPLAGVTVRSALTLPAPTAGVELHGVALACTTIKPSDDGEWMVLRCVNLADEPGGGRWRIPGTFKEARRARLDETPGDAMPMVDGMIAFDAGPREIVTFLVR
jgi:alpha-mannosidase